LLPLLSRGVGIAPSTVVGHHLKWCSQRSLPSQNFLSPLGNAFANRTKPPTLIAWLSGYTFSSNTLRCVDISLCYSLFFESELKYPPSPNAGITVIQTIDCKSGRLRHVQKTKIKVLREGIYNVRRYKSKSVFGITSKILFYLLMNFC